MPYRAVRDLKPGDVLKSFVEFVPDAVVVSVRPAQYGLYDLTTRTDGGSGQSRRSPGDTEYCVIPPYEMPREVATSERQSAHVVEEGTLPDGRAIRRHHAFPVERGALPAHWLTVVNRDGEVLVGPPRAEPDQVVRGFMSSLSGAVVWPA